MKKLLALMVCLALANSPSLMAADSASEGANAILLLNVISEGPLSARDVVFTNVETGAELRVRNLQNISRLSETKFRMEDIVAGEYYLSSIYPTLNRNDNASRIDLDESSGIITILPNTINYIGDLIVTSEETGRGIETSFTYQANGVTLQSAAASETANFQEMDTVVSIAGNQPVMVDKRLLGL